MRFLLLWLLLQTSLLLQFPNHFLRLVPTTSYVCLSFSSWKILQLLFMEPERHYLWILIKTHDINYYLLVFLCWQWCHINLFNPWCSCGNRVTQLLSLLKNCPGKEFNSVQHLSLENKSKRIYRQTLFIDKKDLIIYWFDGIKN